MKNNSNVRRRTRTRSSTAADKRAFARDPDKIIIYERHINDNRVMMQMQACVLIYN